MRWSPETVRSILLCLAVVASELGASVSSFDSKCPPLKLVSGRSRYRWRGRSVRFNCMRGFQLVGVKYATCMNGKWDADVPICVKYGCRAPNTSHVNGQFIESYRGAVVKIVCNPGYSLLGSPSVYCNGLRWNETFPVCRVTNADPALSCDFEDPDLCGWTQDPMHDFDWKRHNGATPSGPKFDHTRGGNDTGFYMYLETSNPRMENDTGRLYSPVYPPSLSNGTCFKFWYMHGATPGYLKVYVKPEGVELYNLIPSFWVVGGQGSSWREASFPVFQTDSPFQVVVEGVTEPGHVGITAFDDVSLASGKECAALETTTPAAGSTDLSSSASPDDDAFDASATCANRCGEDAPVAEEGRCSCHETCDREGTCCPSYYYLCPFESTESSTGKTSETEPGASASSPSPPGPRSTTPPEPSPESPSEAVGTPPTAFPKHFNNESNEIDPGKPFPEAAPPRSPPERSHPASPPPPARGGKPSDRGANETAAEGERKPTPREDVSRTRAATSTTPARVTKSTKPPGAKLSFFEKPSSPRLTNESRFHKGKPKEPPGKEPPQAIKIDGTEESGRGGLRGAIEVGGTALAVLVIIVLGVLWYRRSQSRKTERETMVEDSDVRFLTSDEVLDFTLARPADDDL